MNHLKTLTRAAALALAVAAGSAQATPIANTTSYHLTTSGAHALDALLDVIATSTAGAFKVTSIRGTYEGLNIASLMAPGGYGGNDNLLFPGGASLVNINGISFLDTLGGRHNLYYGSENNRSNQYRMFKESNGSMRVSLEAANAVPEPASAALLALGIAGLVASRKRRSDTAPAL